MKGQVWGGGARNSMVGGGKRQNTWNLPFTPSQPITLCLTSTSSLTCLGCILLKWQ